MKVLYVDTFSSRRPRLVFNALGIDGEILQIGKRELYAKAFSVKIIPKLLGFIFRFLKTYGTYDMVIINNRLGRIFFPVYPIMLVRKILGIKTTIVIDYLDDAWRQNFYLIKYSWSIKDKLLNFILFIASSLGDIMSVLIVDKVIGVSSKMLHWYLGFLRRFGRNVEGTLITNKVPEDFVRFDEEKVPGYIKMLANEKYIFMVTAIRYNIDWNFVFSVASVLKNKNIKFLIAGTGPLLEKLRNMAERHGLNNLVFLGYLDWDSIKYLIKNAAVCVDFEIKELRALSSEENMNKIQEYLAFKKIIITNWLENKGKNIFRIDNPQEILRFF